MPLPLSTPASIEDAIASLHRVKSLTRKESGPWLEADNALQILQNLQLADLQTAQKRRSPDSGYIY